MCKYFEMTAWLGRSHHGFIKNKSSETKFYRKGINFVGYGNEVDLTSAKHLIKVFYDIIGIFLISSEFHPML